MPTNNMSRQPLFPYEKCLFVLIGALCFQGFCSDSARSSHLWNLNYGDREIFTMAGICVLGYLADYFVLGWHSQSPPHPKFRMRRARKFSLAVHVVGGSVELLCLAPAFVASNPAPFARTAAFAALALHVPTSFYMTPAVFGIKRFMVPGYFMFILQHAFTAYQVLANPSDGEALLRLCLALHGYVWVRVSIFIFKTLGVAKEIEYTLACLFTLFLNTPLILSPASNFLCPVGFVLFHYINELLVKWNLAPWDSHTTEYGRETVITERSRFEKALLEVSRQSVGNMNGMKIMTRMDIARAVFDHMDRNGDGSLGIKELMNSMAQMGIQEEDLRAKFKACGVDHQAMNFTKFCTFIWPMIDVDAAESLLDGRLRVVPFNPSKQIPIREQAELVHQALDVDGSGDLSIDEIRDVVVSWGLPQWEATKMMEMGNRDGNGKIDVDEFRLNFEPMWRYAYKLLEDEIIYERKIVVEHYHEEDKMMKKSKDIRKRERGETKVLYNEEMTRRSGIHRKFSRCSTSATSRVAMAA